MTAMTLTPKETEMLVAVMCEMGEIPNSINFDNVAARVDVKYGKNARQSFKKLFEKLKAQAGSSPDGEDRTTPPKTPSPTKRAPPKKKVGPKNTPIKATPKPKGKKGAKKEVKEEFDDSDSPLEEPELNDEDGKSPNHSSTLALKKTGKKPGVSHSNGSSESVQTSDEDTKMSVEVEEPMSAIGENEDDDQGTPDEQLQAERFGMTTAAYREWQSLNNYPDYDNFVDEV